MANRKGQISIGNVSVSNASGILRSIVIADTTDGSGNYDATISINIDGGGAVVYTLNDLNGRNGIIVSGSQYANGDNLIPAEGVASLKNVNQLFFNLEFTSSLAVTFANNDASFTVWDEDAF